MEELPKVSQFYEKHKIKNREGAEVHLSYRYPHETFQWISRIKKASSTYAAGWETETMIGPPRVFPQYGDIRGAWAPRSSSGTQESLQVVYEHPVYVTGVDLFLTYNPGHVVRLSLLKCADPEIWDTIWEEPFHKHLPQTSIVQSPPLKYAFTPFKSNILKIDLDCKQARSWCEIDCVTLRGLQFIEWEPSRHHEFPPSFKRMVKCFLLVNNRFEGTGMWLPKVLVFEIFKFCALSWNGEDKDVESVTKDMQDLKVCSVD
eukprot:TRINITY_DN4612_c0_g1_i1.p1 TRINITY_DN4612_c0_g1~~TRINITY_DN4612_c0_g1_i1.p1  ORF type:complete len:267 (-),score=31.10 TRINITY_DN4612_c0_g1_i1:22-801(-)